MKKFFAEFKKFVMRGNVLDMAVGVIIGGAFTAIVTSLNKDLLTPLLGLIGGTDFSDLKVTLVEGVPSEVAGEWVKAPVELMYGNFITAIINFLITAFVIFCLVKAITKLMDGRKKPEAPAAPTEKDCPFCKSKIHIDATRCPNCTSTIDK